MMSPKLRSSVVFGLFLIVGLVALSGCASQPGPVSVDIAYRNHPPVRAVLEDVDALLAKYDEQVRVTRYDIDTPEGESFLQGKQVTDSAVLAIFIGGSMAYQQGDQQVQFFSFPVGRGTAITEAGNWTLDDLDAALAQAVGARQ